MIVIILKSKPSIQVKDIIDSTDGYYIGKPKRLSGNVFASSMYPMDLWMVKSCVSEKEWKSLDPDEIRLLMKPIIKDLTPHCMYQFAQKVGLDYIPG